MLAKSTGSPSVIALISTYLTVTCGVVYILYLVKVIIGNWVAGKIGCNFDDVVGTLLLAVLPVGGFIFFMYILATEVIFAQDDDPPLSGELEVAAFVVYGITAFFVGGFSMLHFCTEASEQF